MQTGGSESITLSEATAIELALTTILLVGALMNPFAEVLYTVAKGYSQLVSRPNALQLCKHACLHTAIIAAYVAED